MLRCLLCAALFIVCTLYTYSVLCTLYTEMVCAMYTVLGVGICGALFDINRSKWCSLAEVVTRVYVLNVCLFTLLFLDLLS